MTGLLLCLALLTDPGLPADQALRGCTFVPLVQEVVTIYPVPLDVLLAQGQVESGWKPWLVGRSGERGAWQCLPQYSALSGAQLAHSRPGLWEGARHLAYRIKQAGGDVRRGLAGYNAGKAAMDDACPTKKCARGRAYAMKVLARARSWRSSTL